MDQNSPEVLAVLLTNRSSGYTVHLQYFIVYREEQTLRCHDVLGCANLDAG